MGALRLAAEEAEVPCLRAGCQEEDEAERLDRCWQEEAEHRQEVELEEAEPGAARQRSRKMSSRKATEVQLLPDWQMSSRN